MILIPLFRTLPPPLSAGHGTCDSQLGVCVCDEGYLGEDCHLDVCEEHRARKAGLIVSYFDDYDFTYLVGMEERPDINRGSTNTLFPGVDRDHCSVVFQGLLRPTESGWCVALQSLAAHGHDDAPVFGHAPLSFGWPRRPPLLMFSLHPHCSHHRPTPIPQRYKFRCVYADGTCVTFLNGTIVTDSTPIMLQANTDYRLKFEHQHENFDDYHRLEWTGPFASEAEANSGAAYSVVPAEHFLHEAVCPDGCSNRGCCIRDNMCSCAAGFSGHDCSLQLDSCDDGPSGALQTGGLRGRYYNDRSFGAQVVERVDGVHMGSNVRPSGVDADDFSARWVGRLRVVQTGFHLIGHVTNSRAVARVIVGGTELYNWAENWNGYIFLQKGQSYSIVVEFRYGLAYDTTVLCCVLPHPSLLPRFLFGPEAAPHVSHHPVLLSAQQKS